MKVELTEDLATCHALRRVVFVEEQGVAEEEEWDGLDDDALHLLAWLADRPVGTARIFQRDGIGKIGRVCVLPEARGTGLGAALIQKAIEVLRQQPGLTTAKLGAQTHAIGFYEKLGFTAFGPIYDDAGIPHRDMTLAL